MVQAMNSNHLGIRGVAGATTGCAVQHSSNREHEGLSAFRSVVKALVSAVTLAAMSLAVVPSLAQSRRPSPPEPQSFDGQAWRRVPVRPGGEMPLRPPPPTAGRNRCISID